MTVSREFEFVSRCSQDLQKPAAADGGCRGRRGCLPHYRSRSARGRRQQQESGSAPAPRTASREVVAAAPAAKADEAAVTGFARHMESRVAVDQELEVANEAKMFHSSAKTSMTVTKYIQRLRKYMACSTEVFVLAMVYIDRAEDRQPGILTSASALRLLLTSVTLAAKFHDDAFYTNGYYSRVGGVSLKEINALEAKLLQFLDWKLLVTPELFEQYRSALCRAAVGLD